jgi:hypothetical protein
LIVIYDLLLFVVIRRSDIDYFGSMRSRKLKGFLGVPFSIHAGESGPGREGVHA